MRKLLSTLLIFSCLVGFSQDFYPEKMQPARLVNAYNSFLNGEEIRKLEKKLRSYRDTTSTEIAIVIVDDTKGDDINLYTAELAERWGIGKKGVDNGMLILVASKDRKISIQNGYGLEEYVTDAKAKLIIDRHIIPHFKKGMPYVGLNQGLNQVFLLLDGKFNESSKAKNPKSWRKRYGWLLFIVIFMIIQIIRNRRGGGGGRSGGGRYHGGYWIGGLGGSNFGGSSFGGGGGSFGGFGGGSFGGGGASGSW